MRQVEYCIVLNVLIPVVHISYETGRRSEKNTISTIIFIVIQQIEENVSSWEFTFHNFLDNFFSVFVPELSRAGTNPLSQFLYQCGHVLVQ